MVSEWLWCVNVASSIVTCTTQGVWGCNNGGGYAGVGAGDIWDICTFSSIGCEPITALKKQNL